MEFGGFGLVWFGLMAFITFVDNLMLNLVYSHILDIYDMLT